MPVDGPARDDLATPDESAKRRWIARAGLAVVGVAAVVAAIVISTKPHHASEPSTRNYRQIGTFDGVSFWIRTGPDNELAVLTTGRLGSLCNGSFAQMPIRAAVYMTLCNDSGPTGAVEAALVPVTSRAAFAGDVPLHLLAHSGAEPAELTLAVLVLGPNAELPQGQIRAS